MATMKVMQTSEGTFSLNFFFSSRRRHTRSLRDWSSDVCSSDLGAVAHLVPHPVEHERVGPLDVGTDQPAAGRAVVEVLLDGGGLEGAEAAGGVGVRSEERRVGKECRSLCSPYHQ